MGVGYQEDSYWLIINNSWYLWKIVIILSNPPNNLMRDHCILYFTNEVREVKQSAQGLTAGKLLKKNHSWNFLGLNSVWFQNGDF